MCPTTPHPITGTQVPLTFGHEFSAIVDEVGEGVTTVQPGDRVSVEPIIWDGECGACLDGFHNCCVNGGFVGLSGQFSGARRDVEKTDWRRMGRRSVRVLCSSAYELIQTAGKRLDGNRR